LADRDNKQTLQKQIDKKNDLETFLPIAPQMNPNCFKNHSVICGYRVERSKQTHAEDRYMDIVGMMNWQKEKMEKILRQ
jgi:hypothetical protein